MPIYQETLRAVFVMQYVAPEIHHRRSDSTTEEVMPKARHTLTYTTHVFRPRPARS